MFTLQANFCLKEKQCWVLLPTEYEMDLLEDQIIWIFQHLQDRRENYLLYRNAPNPGGVELFRAPEHTYFVMGFTDNAFSTHYLQGLLYEMFPNIQNWRQWKDKILASYVYAINYYVL